MIVKFYIDTPVICNSSHCYICPCDNNLVVRKIPLEDFLRIVKKYNLRTFPVEEYPYMHRHYYSIEEYVEEHPELKVLKNKRVYLMMTGGKDSTLAYLVLKYVEADVKPIYVHLPYFEDLLYIESQRIFERTETTVIEIPRQIVKEKILKRGMPTRKRRWCTSLKFRVLKKYIREKIEGQYYIADAVRRYESRPRERRLAKKSHIGKRRVYPILDFTNADAYAICYHHNLLNPIYRYSTRASCTICPNVHSTFTLIRWLNYVRKDPENAEDFIKTVESINLKINDIILLNYMYPKKLVQLLKRARLEYEEYPEIKTETVAEAWWSYLKQKIIRPEVHHHHSVRESSS